MGIKHKVIRGFVAAMIATLVSCGGKGSDSSKDELDLLLADSIPVDTLNIEEEGLSLVEDKTPQFDGLFNDFLFAYLHSHSLRQERTTNPLPLEHLEHSTEILKNFCPEHEFSFLTGEYFTTLYGSATQMHEEDEEEFEEDSIVNLQRICLNDGSIRNFQFLRAKGQWRLEAIRETAFDNDELDDFLSFYARFSSDSLFQSQSIADPLRISIQDADDEDGNIDGIIDAAQWQTFCPEVPCGIISNIRKGQDYSGNRILLRKSGLSNGLQEVFTFTKERGTWHLTKYEN